MRRIVLAASIALPMVAVSAMTSVAPATKVLMPADNLLSNPSFETSLDPWTTNSSPLARVSPSGALAAPDGNYLARVSAEPSSGSYRVLLDNLPGETKDTAAGTSYAGSAWVAAANPDAVGHAAYLVVREKSSSGVDIAVWTSAPISLTTTGYSHLTVNGTAHRSGDDIDLYVYEAAPAQNDAIYVDAISLESSYSVPITDLVANSSFESGGSWAATNATFTRPTTASAPDGAAVARVNFTGVAGAQMGIDSTASATTTKGQHYSAASLVRASGTAAVGRTALVRIEEQASGGAVVAHADSATVALTQPWITVSTNLTAVNDGDRLVLRIIEQDAQPGDAIGADAAWLAADASGLGELAINYAQDDPDALGNTAKYEVVVLQAQHFGGDPDSMKRIHDANPLTQVFGLVNSAAVYKYADCSGPQPESDVYNGYALNYCWVRRNHADWFLHRKRRDGTEGAALAYGDNGLIMMNMGLPAYQDAWEQAVEDYFSTRTDASDPSEPFDGVYLDDVNTTPGHQVDAKVYEYTDEQYGHAVTEFVDNVGHKLHDAGFRTLANVAVGGDYQTTRTWEVPDAMAIAADLDGVNKEFLGHYGSNNYKTCPASTYEPVFSGSVLAGWQDYAVGVNSGTSYGHRTMFTGIDYEQPTDRAVMTYGRADFLLTWPGEPGSGAYLNRPCTNGDPADPAWTTQLGLPTDPVEPPLTGGLYVRHYTQGIVLLNPAASGAAASFGLDGTFVDQDGHTYRNQTVVVAPSTAVLLTRTSYA